MKTDLIKLTKLDMTTYGGFKYELGKEYRFPGTGPLCSSGWSHLYITQPMAELMNPIHANFSPYRVFVAEGVVGARDSVLKVGCSSVTLVRELDALNPTAEQRIAAAIAWAWPLHVKDRAWRLWAQRWLSGEDRSEAAARAAAWAAAWAARAAAWAARAGAWAAAWAAEAAAWAARAGESERILLVSSWACRELRETDRITIPQHLLCGA